MVKDAYAKLKGLIHRRAAQEVEILDAKPASEARRSVVVEILDALPEDQIIELEGPAHQLIDLLERANEERPIGVDITRLKAMNVTFKNVRVTAGTGIVAHDVELKGDFSVESLDVGHAPGKSSR